MENISNIIDYAKMAEDAYRENDEPSKYQTEKNYVSSENTSIERIFIHEYAGDVDVSIYKKKFLDSDGVSFDEIVVSFGGTNSPTDGASDAIFGLPYFNGVCEEIKKDVMNAISKNFTNPPKITAVGHSLGGCYAELFASSFYSNEDYQMGKKVNLYTFNGLGATKGISVYQAEIIKDKNITNTSEDPTVIYDNIGIYNKNKIGVAEHYSNSKDIVSPISNHLSGIEFTIPGENFFLNIFGNHSIDTIISDLEKAKNKEITIIFSEYNNINPEDYSYCFDGAEPLKIMSGFDDIKGGTIKDEALNGATQNSYLEGGVGHDQLTGGAGNDFLSGGVGRDILADSEEDISKMKSLSLRTDSGNKYVGGKDDDTIIDTAGNDTIFYNKGDGHDLMVLSETLRDSDKVIFGEDIKPGNLSFIVSGDKMVMHIAKGKDKEGSLTFDNWFTSKNTSAQKVELFVFKDGTELTWQQISEMATMKVKFGTEKSDDLRGDNDVKNVIYGLDGNDKIYGKDNNDVIYGGNGNDTIDGGRGDDRIIGGKGNDIIDNKAGVDVIEYNIGDGDDIIIANNILNFHSRGIADDKILFTGGINPSDVSYRLEKDRLIISISKSGVKNGSITINDWYINDKNDYYEFGGGLSFEDGSLILFKDMNYNILNHGNIGNEDNNEITGLSWKENIIRGNGGNDKLTGGLWHDEIYGGDGNDIIYGDSSGLTGGNDLIIGGRGDDIIYDEQFGRRFLYNRGDGNDTILPRYDVNENTIIFGAGILPSDVSFSRKGMDMVIGIKNSGTITIVNRPYIPGVDTPNVDSLIEYYQFEGEQRRISSYDIKKYVADAAYQKKSTEMSSRASHQYDILSQEMAASDADAEPTVDYNKQNQDLYAYIEH